MQDGKTYVYGLGGYDGTNPAASGVKDLVAAVEGKASKPATYTEGNLAEFDSEGNPTDSGFPLADINGTNVRIGQNAVSKKNSVVIGNEAKDRSGDNAVLIGNSTILGNDGRDGGNNCVVIGNGAQVNSLNQNQKAPSDCMAIGKNAKVYLDGSQFGAVQIGEGTNTEAKSLKFRDTVIVDGNGKIPSANIDVEVVTKELVGQEFDFATTQGFMDAIAACVRALGGTVVNNPSEQQGGN